MSLDLTVISLAFALLKGIFTLRYAALCNSQIINYLARRFEYLAINFTYGIACHSNFNVDGNSNWLGLNPIGFIAVILFIQSQGLLGTCGV